MTEADKLLPKPPMAEDADQSAHYQQADAPVNAQEQVLTLATALVLEAGGEKAPGAMQAVLNVISNRAKGDFNRAYAVVLKPYQFSALNSYTVEHGSLSALINRASQHPRWNEAISLVQKLQQHKLVDITGGATNYYATWMDKRGVVPRWAEKMKTTTIIGGHRFLKQV